MSNGHFSIEGLNLNFLFEDIYLNLFGFGLYIFNGQQTTSDKVFIFFYFFYIYYRIKNKN